MTGRRPEVRQRNSHRQTPTVVRRRRAAAGALLLAVVAVTIVVIAGPSVGGASSPDRKDRASRSPAMVEVFAGTTRVVSLPVEQVTTRLARLLSAKLPAQGRVARGRAQLVVRYDARSTIRRAVALGRRGGRIQASRKTIAAETPAPVLAQAQRNTCESAALQILLAAAGRSIDQRRLQKAFPRSGALDPSAFDTPDMTWGDPDVGYVGRPDGGGTAGGFGIYPGPVQRTANRFGVRLANVTGQSPNAIYARLRQGAAVMVWVGLSSGPYGSWSTPSGRRIKVNFGEHTVVLHGINADGSLDVSNPLQGTSERWTDTQFEAMWKRLGNRGLAT